MATVQVENLATNGLDYLLCKYPAAAEAFIRLARQAAPRLGETLKFRTQARWEDGAIPDMVGCFDDAQVLIVEAKFWADLTPNQPVTYIRRLPESSCGLVLVICPSQRTRALWQELSKRCCDSEMSVSEIESPRSGLQVARVGVQRCLAVVSWDTVLSELESALEAAGQVAGAADLDQLRGLCDAIDQVALQPVELGEPRDSAASDLTAFVDDIAAALVGSGDAHLDGYRATPGSGYYKRYMKLHGWANWCIEWNLDYFQRFGSTTLWLSTTVKKPAKFRLDRLAAGVAQSRFAGSQFLIPLAGANGSARVHLLHLIVERVRALREPFIDATDD